MKQTRLSLGTLFMALVLLGMPTPAKGKLEETAKAAPEKVKAKLHQAADALDQKKVNEKIDEVADYFDPEKMKEKVDEIADFFDRNQVKELVDYIADNLDRDKVKGFIDQVADKLDRERLKEGANQVIGSIDKEQLKEKIDESVDKVAASLQEATQKLEHEVRKLGNNPQALKGVMSQYNWSRYLPDRATYGPATLSNLKLGGSRKAILAKPGELIEGEVDCSLNRKQCSALSLYRVVLGIKNKGGQTTVFNHFGLRAGDEKDHFTLKAPQEKGVYEVGFRVVEAAREGTAIQAWDDKNENGAGEPVTIGLIVVS